MKVFIGMTEIAGYYNNLAIGLRENGFEVEEFYLSDHTFQYNSGKKTLPFLFKLYRKLRAKRERNGISRFSRYFYYLSEILVSCGFFLWAVSKFDVFVFGYRTSILYKNSDLRVLRKMNKIVVSVVAHGSESRPPYVNGAKRLANGEFLSAPDLVMMAQVIEEQMRVIENNSDYVIAAPFTSQYLRKPFINHFHIGLPYKPKTVSVFPGRSKTGKSVRILHSPSKPLAKGTYEIRNAIKSLKIQGYEIDFVEVINQPNSVVIDELQRCDFIIDQLYSDTPLAAFATEAAFYGKPAVVGGYGWELLKKLLPKDVFPPSEICHPDYLEFAVIKLIEDLEYRQQLGARAKSFVSEHWAAKVVAAKFAKIFLGQVSNDWLLDPYSINYVAGVGISEADAKKLVTKVLDHGGEEALHLKGRKTLQDAFVDFASGAAKIGTQHKRN